MPQVKSQISTILQDSASDKHEKIRRLRQLEFDARARERGATEGFAAVDGDNGEDLKAIEQALIALGAETAETGAATL